VLSWSDPAIYVRFIGPLHPIVVFLLVSMLGLLCFSTQLTRRGFHIYQGKNQARRIRVLALALLFPAITILIDMSHPFPENINVAFPTDLLPHLAPDLGIRTFNPFVLGAPNQYRMRSSLPHPLQLGL
jgi:hypothetical protein